MDNSMTNLKRQSKNEKNHIETKKKKKKKDNASDKNEAACETQHDLKKNAHLTAELFHDNCEMNHCQIHELLKYATLGKCESATQPSWCRIRNQKHLSGVVVIVLKDLSQVHFYRFYLQFRFLRRMFKHKFSLPPPRPKLLSILMGMNQKTTKDDQKNMTNRKDVPLKTEDVPPVSSNIPISLEDFVLYQMNPIIQKYGFQKCGLTKYILSKQEMFNQNFPFLGLPDCINFVGTDCWGIVTDKSPLFGLDCEMCLTEKGKELTRICLVTADGDCLIDELVKPKNPIVNYLTRFSGITREMLIPVKTTLQEIQKRIKDVLPPDAVLVGHSLNNDLRALKMVHSSVIDTSIIYPRENGGRFKLKYLAEAVLGKEIQNENQEGHDPAEDAKATLQLAQFLIHCGPMKVAELNLNQYADPTANDGATGNAAKKDLNGEPVNQSSIAVDDIPSLFKTLHSNGQQCVFLSRPNGTKDLPSSSHCKHIVCSSDEEVLKQAKEEVPQSSLSIVQFSLGPENTGRDLIQRLHAKMAAQLAEMMTVYAGPFKGVFSLPPVTEVFEMCGPIRSINLITETQQSFVCIQYEVLEAAQLAVEILDGASIDGNIIKVQRPVKETTLDCEAIIQDLDIDIETENIIYVAGIKQLETEKDLRKRFSHLKELQHIYLPRDEKSGSNRKYCFLKFTNHASAKIALTAINEPFEGELKGRRALTPRHMHDWAQQQNLTRPSEKYPGLGNPFSEQNIRNTMKKLDKIVKRLYKSLHDSTLCLVLLPGIDSFRGSFSGLGLMGIVADEEDSESL